MRLGDFPSKKNMTADKQLFYQDANQSDASIAEKMHYASTKGRAHFGPTILFTTSLTLPMNSLQNNSTMQDYDDRRR